MLDVPIKSKLNLLPATFATPFQRILSLCDLPCKTESLVPRALGCSRCSMATNCKAPRDRAPSPQTILIDVGLCAALRHADAKSRKCLIPKKSVTAPRSEIIHFDCSYVSDGHDSSSSSGSGMPPGRRATHGYLCMLIWPAADGRLSAREQERRSSASDLPRAFSTDHECAGHTITGPSQLSDGSQAHQPTASPCSISICIRALAFAQSRRTVRSVMSSRSPISCSE